MLDKGYDSYVAPLHLRYQAFFSLFIHVSKNCVWSLMNLFLCDLVVVEERAMKRRIRECMCEIRRMKQKNVKNRKPQ